MSYSLDKDITSTTDYVELVCPFTTTVNLQVANGAVYIGFGDEPRDPGFYNYADEPFLPVVGALHRRCDRIRIKARAPISSPAPHVILTAIPGRPDDE